MQNRLSISKTKLSSECIFRLTREALVVTWRLIDSSLSHGQRPMYDVTHYVQEAGICKIKTSSETKKIQMFVIGKDCNKFRGEGLRLGKGG